MKPGGAVTLGDKDSGADRLVLWSLTPLVEEGSVLDKVAFGLDITLVRADEEEVKGARNPFGLA